MTKKKEAEMKAKAKMAKEVQATQVEDRTKIIDYNLEVQEIFNFDDKNDKTDRISDKVSKDIVVVNKKSDCQNGEHDENKLTIENNWLDTLWNESFNFTNYINSNSDFSTHIFSSDTVNDSKSEGSEDFIPKENTQIDKFKLINNDQDI